VERSNHCALTSSFCATYKDVQCGQSHRTDTERKRDKDRNNHVSVFVSVKTYTYVHIFPTELLLRR